MSTELKIPPVGDSIVEVQIGKWLKKEGDFAKIDETVVELETDKANVEVPSPITGRIVKLLKRNGETAKIGEVIAHLEEGEAKTSAASSTTSASAVGGAAAKPSTPASNSVDSARVMPAAQRVIAQNNVSASAVAPSGPGGRLLKEDVERHLRVAPSVAPASSIPPAVSPSASPASIAPVSSVAFGRTEELVPMTMIRKRIAERLVGAQQTMAILTTFNEVDMTKVMDLRKLYQDSFTKRYQIKLGFMGFFVKAVVDALKQYPALNAEIREHNIVYRNYYDVGVAIGGGKGLVVPVIRNAERLSFAEIEQKIAEFGKRAQEGKISVDEMTGGTFSISNGGVYGSLLSTPIINPPQSGILGMHAIQERPVAIEGQVVVRPMMYLALSYDHRIVDGREAVSFLKRIKETVEDPTRMLIEI